MVDRKAGNVDIDVDSIIEKLLSVRYISSLFANQKYSNQILEFNYYHFPYYNRHNIF